MFYRDARRGQQLVKPLAKTATAVRSGYSCITAVWRSEVDLPIPTAAAADADAAVAIFNQSKICRMSAVSVKQIFQEGIFW